MTLLQYAANDVMGWFADLQRRGFDLSAQPLKVKKEGAEFADNPSLEEAADVLITIFGAAQVFGWSTGMLARAVQEKMVVNRERVWAKGEDGTYQHIDQ